MSYKIDITREQADALLNSLGPEFCPAPEENLKFRKRFDQDLNLIATYFEELPQEITLKAAVLYPDYEPFLDTSLDGSTLILGAENAVARYTILGYFDENPEWLRMCIESVTMKRESK